MIGLFWRLKNPNTWYPQQWKNIHQYRHNTHELKFLYFLNFRVWYDALINTHGQRELMRDQWTPIAESPLWLANFPLMVDVSACGSTLKNYLFSIVIFAVSRYQPMVPSPTLRVFCWIHTFAASNRILPPETQWYPRSHHLGSPHVEAWNKRWVSLMVSSLKTSLTLWQKRSLCIV